MKYNPNREYLTAIAIHKGIIQLIDPDGQIVCYRQRGIQTLGKEIIASEIRKGYLHNLWQNYKELPANWSISFEDPEIMGRALATYPMVLIERRNKRAAKNG